MNNLPRGRQADATGWIIHATFRDREIAAARARLRVELLQRFGSLRSRQRSEVHTRNLGELSPVVELEPLRLIDLFDHRFSVDDTAKRHKPAPEAYAEVTRALGANPAEMCMVACHTWDTIGAQAAGWEAGLIKRTNNDVLDTAAYPQYVGNDLNIVADQIIARNDPRRG